MNKEYETLIEKGCTEAQAQFAMAASNYGVRTLAMHGSVNMQAFIKGPKQPDEERTPLYVLELPEVDQHIKIIFYENVRYVAHTNNAEMTAIISEIWMPPADLSKAEVEAAIKKYNSISQMPGHREGIMIAMGDKDGTKAAVNYELKRDENGQISEITPETVMTDREKGGELKGLMFSTFYTEEEIADPNFDDRLETVRQMMSMMAVEGQGAPGGMGNSIN